MISSDPVDLFLCKSDISKNGLETLSTRGFSCRVTRWAPELFRGGPHISVGLMQVFSHCVSLEIFPLLSEHTQGCY